MTIPSTTNFVRTMVAKLDHLAGLTTAASRIDLIRPGDRRQRYAGQVFSDVFLFSDTSYASNCALNSDRSRLIEGHGCSFNVHPSGTQAIENDLHHSGECLIVEFTHGLLNDSLADAASLLRLDRSITNQTDARITRLAQDVRRSVLAARRGDHINTLYVDGLLMAMRAVLAETYRTGATDGLFEHSARRFGDTRIARAIDYAEAHLGDALTVAQLAAVATLSEGHFSRAFKAITGESVWTYVQRRRAERARDMLETTDLPIARIAHACGFANQGHLTSYFRQHFGTTPGAVRRERQLPNGR